MSLIKIINCYLEQDLHQNGDFFVGGKYILDEGQVLHKRIYDQL